MTHILSLHQSIPNTVGAWTEGKLETLTASSSSDPESSLEELGDGITLTLTGGAGWAGDGVIQAPTTYRMAWDNLEYLSDGTVTGQALIGGTGWAASGFVQ